MFLKCDYEKYDFYRFLLYVPCMLTHICTRTSDMTEETPCTFNSMDKNNEQYCKRMFLLYY